MRLDLDKRHRAMLREMGVRVWLPMTAEGQEPAREAADAPTTAIKYVANKQAETAVEPQFDPENARAQPALAPASAAPPPRTPPAARAPLAAALDRTATPVSRVAVSWRLGEPCALYADAAPAEGARWLVLAETPAAWLQANPVFNPFHGDAGKLLDNMLRAARLHQAGRVMLAPLTRQAAAGEGPDFASALQALLASTQPDLVLVMGRLAALALLPSSDAFGKLRGQVHSLHGVKTVVTYDATYLLRTQGDKARAWDDLCLAKSIVAAN